ncbi:uncharacterized protein N7511_008498 [Penicillium nucicola]|uniref:uncharacterized protein n=1 Tax=Penicillium nucicola TaxID=1850975 RepID=UPI0025456CB8|nr:uncharacterized protein N7511_008498 [Penicillium nucicola]KAJ5751533.1 hypothetical protein N7511_008498 [Penicillium nucicola]
MEATLFRSLLYCCLTGLLIAVSYQRFLANASFLLGRVVAAVILPPCFGAPSYLGGYKPRPEYWDLDLDGRKPVLFSFKTPFSEVRAYYVPPLQQSDVQQLIVGYPGNTRAVGALMSDFWQHFGPHVHLMLVNPPGYGHFDEDRSSPMIGRNDALLEAWLRAIPDTLERDFLTSPNIEWERFNPRTVVKNDNVIKTSAGPIDKLPRTFVDWNIIGFGRSFGAFLDSCSPSTSDSDVLYMAFQSIEKINPAGIRGLIWRLLRPWNPFPSCGSQLIPDALQSSLNEPQRQFIKGYNGTVFTGLTSNLAPIFEAGKMSLVAVASREDVVGRMEAPTQGTDGMTYFVLEGDHGALPNADFKRILRKHLDDCAAAHRARQLGQEEI